MPMHSTTCKCHHIHVKPKLVQKAIKTDQCIVIEQSVNESKVIIL